MKEETKQRAGRKIFQYGMLLVLFGAAFLLPGYALRLQREAGQAQIKQQESAEEDASADAAQSGQDALAGEAAGASGTIVLDAGHGGEDPGMVGASGASEKVLNLIYAKKLQALLEANGYRVVQTRETEEGLYDENETHKKAQDMQRRCAIIAEAQPLLTVSIHQNSYPDASVCGPQVFYYDQSKEGEKLALAIQDSLNAQLSPSRPKQAKGNGSYYILKRSKSVTVIVECGFLTNPEEEARLQEESYQDQVAQAICDGILQYLAQQAEKQA